MILSLPEPECRETDRIIRYHTHRETGHPLHRSCLTAVVRLRARRGATGPDRTADPRAGAPPRRTCLHFALAYAVRCACAQSPKTPEPTRHGPHFRTGYGFRSKHHGRVPAPPHPPTRRKCTAMCRDTGQYSCRVRLYAARVVCVCGCVRYRFTDVRREGRELTLCSERCVVFSPAWRAMRVRSRTRVACRSRPVEHDSVEHVEELAPSHHNRWGSEPKAAATEPAII